MFLSIKYKRQNTCLCTICIDQTLKGFILFLSSFLFLLLCICLLLGFPLCFAQFCLSSLYFCNFILSLNLPFILQSSLHEINRNTFISIFTSACIRLSALSALLEVSQDDNSSCLRTD